MKSTVPISNFDRTKPFPKMAIGLGASGYLLKNSASAELFTASSRRSWKTYVTPLVTKGMRLGVFPRGPRACLGEAYLPPARKCCNSSHEGRAMKEIADRLQVRARTAAFHKYTIM